MEGSYRPRIRPGPPSYQQGRAGFRIFSPLTTYGRTSSALWILYALFLLSCGTEQASLYTDTSPKPILQIAPYPLYDFGTLVVGGARTQHFTVTNAGSVSAEGVSSSFGLSINFVYEGGSFPGTSGDCADKLAPGGQCTLAVEFRPQYAGSFEQAIRVNYGDGTRTWTTDSPVLRGSGAGP